MIYPIIDYSTITIDVTKDLRALNITALQDLASKHQLFSSFKKLVALSKYIRQHENTRDALQKGEIKQTSLSAARSDVYAMKNR